MIRTRPSSAATPRSILLSASVGALLCGLAIGITGCSPAADQPSVPSFGTLELNEAELKEEIFATIGIDDTIERNRRWIEIVDAVNEGNLAGGIAAFDERLNRVNDREIRYFANKWARIDAEGALDHILEEWTYPKPKNEAVLEVVYVWVRHGDSKAAREYVSPSIGVPIHESRSPKKFMVQAVLYALAAEGDFDELTKLLASQSNPGDRELWLTKLMVEMNRVRGMEAVKSWVNSISWDAPYELKSSAMRRGLDWLAKLSIPQATTWYEEIESHERASELLRSVTAVYGTREPASAILWLSEREPTKERTQLSREVLRGWMEGGQEKADQAEAFLLEHRENSLVNNDLLLLLANYYAHNKRYREAADLVQTVPEDLVPRSLAAVFVEWSSLDVGQVEAYIQEKQISQDIVDRYKTALEATPVKVQRRRTPPQK